MSPAAPSSARTSPTSAPSATSARSTWFDSKPSSSRSSSLCALAGLAKAGTIALDGTKIKANASRPKAMSDGRMKAEEERLKQEIAKLLAAAQAAEAAEDLEPGPD